MNVVFNKTIKILLNWFIGPLLLIWLSWSLYNQVKNQSDLHRSIQLILHAPFGAQGYKFWLVIFLVFVNWGLEAGKWQLLMQTIQPMRFFTAFKSVLCGVTLSLNTPNRIGEYGGRILFVNDGNRLKAVSLSITGSISQLIITLLMGTGGLIFILNQSPENTVTLPLLHSFWIKSLLYLNLCGSALLLLFYFRLGWIVRLIEKIPNAGKAVNYIAVLENFGANILLRLLSISAIRYIVFVLQYVLMMQVFDVEVGGWQSFWILTVLFWVLAIVPSFAIAEIGVRGKFGVALLGIFSSNITGILAVTFGIWFFNLFIPAVTGGFLILSKKYFKEK
ncbi:MAG: hypothetical protein ABJA78_05065 [Ferruginibacter sp.]